MRKYEVEKHATIGNTAIKPRPSINTQYKHVLHTKKLKKQKCRKENKHWDEWQLWTVECKKVLTFNL